FEHWLGRVGLGEAATAVHPSPFDHEAQALLALPRDLVAPDAPGFLEASGACVVEAVRIADGGAFVLCTSYDAVRYYARALRAALPPDLPVLEQTGASRAALLDR